VSPHFLVLTPPKVAYPATSSGGLSRADQDILWRIYYESDSIFEMGVGESTKIAAFTGVPRFTGVDGSIDWLSDVGKVSPSHYRFHWGDIGTIRDWSNPVDSASKPKWPFFSTAALAAESEAFDFYLVDGRFRVASFCACLLHASLHGKDPADFRIGMHDFARPNYQVVLRVAKVVEGHNPHIKVNPAQISVMRRKPEVTDSEIMAIWQEHSMVYE